jgi:hypothetical protein
MKKKFMLLYLAPVAAEQQMNVSPEDMTCRRIACSRWKR